jgi:hypothetical protein
MPFPGDTNEAEVTVQVTDDTAIFAHALNYAEQGYDVFPLIPGDKKPLIKNGCTDASTDTELIGRWIEMHPNANIGIKAGTDVLILDIDNKDGKSGSDDIAEVETDLGNLPDCPRVATPTGGQHLYFKHPGVDVIGQAGVEWKGHKTGIDIRIGNQYVVAPPSIHPVTGTSYLWEIPLVPKADIVILNDFNRQSYRGIALAALGIIYYEDMTGILTTIPNTDCSPIYLGRTVDLFESLVLAGHIPKWDGTFEEAD